MDVDFNAAPDASAFAVLLHPHPDYGGDRLHPFVDGLFRRLPARSVSAIRFDFATAAIAPAHDEVLAPIDRGADRWPQLPVVLVGYSFGAGIAATVDDPRVAGWYLLAPPSLMLADAPIGDDRRPKTVLVPENDQFSPPPDVERLTRGWQSVVVATLDGADHFLGDVGPAVEHALSGIDALLGR